jgi:hypothetical protein
MQLAVDVSRIADGPLREAVQQAVLDLGHETASPGAALRAAERGRGRQVIVADFSDLAAAYARSGWAAWRECFPSMSPLLVAFVRHRDDQRWAHLMDGLMRASACRLWVYKLGLSTLKTDLGACLLEFSKHLDPEAVLDVQYSPADRTVRIDFANGVRRTLPWSALQLPPLRPALLPETIRVGEDPELIEILDGAGEVYDIATARLRAFAGPAR